MRDDHSEWMLCATTCMGTRANILCVRAPGSAARSASMRKTTAPSDRSTTCGCARSAVSATHGSRTPHSAIIWPACRATAHSCASRRGEVSAADVTSIRPAAARASGDRLAAWWSWCSSLISLKMGSKRFGAEREDEQGSLPRYSTRTDGRPLCVFFSTASIPIRHPHKRALAYTLRERSRQWPGSASNLSGTTIGSTTCGVRGCLQAHATICGRQCGRTKICRRTRAPRLCTPGEGREAVNVLSAAEVLRQRRAGNAARQVLLLELRHLPRQAVQRVSAARSLAMGVVPQQCTVLLRTAGPLVHKAVVVVDGLTARVGRRTCSCSSVVDICGTGSCMSCQGCAPS